jgi:hypothetical protein
MRLKELTDKQLITETKRREHALFPKTTKESLKSFNEAAKEMNRRKLSY